jgi:hypothetical protein
LPSSFIRRLEFGFSAVYSAFASLTAVLWLVTAEICSFLISFLGTAKHLQRALSMPSTNCIVIAAVVFTDRSGELQRRWKEGAAEAAAAAAAARSVTFRRITGATKGRAGGAEQPAVQRHDEPERVIRRPPEPAARRRQHRRHPRAAAVGGLLRRVLEMTSPRHR